MNDITSGCLSSIFGSSSTMSPQGFSGGGMDGLDFLKKLKDDIESLLSDLTGAGGGADGSGGGLGGYGNRNDSPFGGDYGSTGNGGISKAIPSNDFGQGQGQGLRDIKLNSAAGGEALHLKMDQYGNLFNGSGNSVGHYDQQTGQLSFNAGATKEIERLETGGTWFEPPFFPNGKAIPTEGPGGNAVFSEQQFTMSVGDLNQKADF
ncbi:hypothetical protein GCT19_40160 [Paraburkholderia sp. CNPSo 3155]|uniref:hypothetical protein n=1 Tax=Paraburkholderia atlantica TaxID=2654982 RepID=UPI00128BA646|nr:hypothetical protein [Paraburkholderia atlantica]MPW11585.1 hypothetical protein [Paraburkholderia atlantica]